jgi:DNA-directed RNA polymerase subunit E'/Rpb7
MENTIVSPYKNVYQFTKIGLKPYMLNSDIKNNMLMVLSKKIENKCNNNGFIETVYDIVEYGDGYMIPENLSGDVIYNVNYHCKICIPIENTVIIAKVNAVNPELIIAENGPIIIFIPKININTNIWEIVNNNFINKNTKKELKQNDFVKILILKKKINQGDIKIKCIGSVIDFTTKDEINKYYGNVIEDDNYIM